MSFWICADTGASKPAFSSSAANCCTRAVFSPDGSPRMSLLPKWCCTNPGSGNEQLACTTQPMMRCAGRAAASVPSGSTDVSRVPASAPPKPCKNHHGTPFIAVSTRVCGPSSGAIWRATSGSDGALTASTTRSCTPKSAGRAEDATACDVMRSPSPSRRRRRKPCSCSASSVAPRATTLTLQPARASPLPIQPPIAPAP